VIVNAVARVVAALNSNRRPGEIGAAAGCAVALALIPAGNLIWIALFVALFLVKVNLSVALLTLAALSPFAGLTDPLLDSIGYRILTVAALQGPLTTLYNLPIAPFTGFNNTLVAGGLALGLVLWIPVYAAARAFVQIYRNTLRAKIAALPPVRWFVKLPIVQRITGWVRWANGAYSRVR